MESSNNCRKTGYASIDMPWLKYYSLSAFNKAIDTPKNVTVWDVLENAIIEYADIPALEYFKREISRPDFLRLVYDWGRALRGLGIEENEIIPIYSTFFPDICAITCALNMIGAVPYFLKLSMSKRDFEVETEGCRFAVVFDGMWDNVKDVFSDDRFKKVIIVTAYDSMLSPKKEIVKVLNYIEQVKSKSLIPRSNKYIWIDEVKKMYEYYTGDVKVPFSPNRNAFITSSSGTSLGSSVKGVIATNESVIAQLYQGDNAGINYNVGDKCLMNYPPTASTALNCLFLLPLYRGMKLMNDPRIGDRELYNQIMKLKPSVVLTTGPAWETFFRTIENKLNSGKKVDLSHAKMWIIGGDGTNLKYYNHWNELMKKCGSINPIYSGYGLSEVFSVLSVATRESTIDATYGNGKIVNVGIPYPGANIKIVDLEGNETGYNEPGELLIKSPTLMKGYYKKAELSNEIFDNGWLHTGDIFSVDENGILYLWGRFDDCLTLLDGTKIYLFDIANKIRDDYSIKDVIINAMPLENGEFSLVAHIIFVEQFSGSKIDKLRDLDISVRDILPSNMEIDGYKEHYVTFKTNPITLKKDRKGLMKELDGYIKVLDSGVYNLNYEMDSEKLLHKNYQKCQEKVLKK